MKYLITGGAGFIGSHLAEALLGAGHDVYVIDDLSTGSIENLAGIKDERRFHYTVGDLTAHPILAEYVDLSDAVFHLAAAVGVRLIVEAPVRTIETNIKGTEVVLNLAAKKKKPVLIASTSEAYGKSSDVPFREDGDCVLGPTTRSRWSYACSKLIDEFLALSYHRERGLPTIVARLFNCVGPRQTGRYGMVVPRFVGQALAGGPITVYGDGAQSRCFADVSDVVRGLIALMNEPKAFGGIFNIGNDEEVTIQELAERVCARVNPRAQIRKVPYDQAYEPGFEDLRRRKPSLERIRALIGYRCTVGLDQIIDRVAQWMKGRAAG
jgi:UDP-glucose 4-epimerase